MGDPSDEQVRRAFASFDDINWRDPNALTVGGESVPKEWWHARLGSKRLTALVDEPSAALRIAVRAAHLRRWAWPRSDHPAGRAGYHAWRATLQKHHAAEACRILEEHGFDRAVRDRVEALITKRELGRDPEAQAFEDVLCLVFVETQLADFAERHEEEKAFSVLRKSLNKMSSKARTVAAALDLDPRAADLLKRAIEAPAPHHPPGAELP